MSLFIRRNTMGSADYVALVFAAVLAFRFLVWWWVDVEDYIDVQTVVIEPTEQGQPIEMHVVRIIHTDFEGGYRVEIRSDNRGSICSTGDVSLFYQKDAKLRKPLRLSYWASGGACQGRIPSDLRPGLHSVRTCHYVLRPWYVLSRKEKCRIDLMEILPRGMTQ